MIKYSQEIPESFYKNVATRAYDILQWEPDLSDDDLKFRYNFSSQYEQWKRDVLRNTTSNMKSTLGVKIVVAITIILIISLLFAMNVASIRDIFYDWIITLRTDHVVTYTNNTTEDDDVLETIRYKYKPSYIPNGYVLVSEEENEICYGLVYSNGVDIIVYKQCIMDTVTQIDIEAHEFKEISNSDIYGYCFTGEDQNLLFWQENNYQFQIVADLPMNEIIEMAKSLISI